MTFFEDLTIHSYTQHAEEPAVLNVGWLGDGQPIRTGPTSAAFRAALKDLCDNRIGLHRGFHVCQYCRRDSRDDWHTIGNGQIRIRAQNGLWYVAPTMIHHYVVEHDYQPPDEFIRAVMNPNEIACAVPDRQIRDSH
jgi:hypothetical protein